MAQNASRGSLEKLIELVATLRAENGCPWDRAQTHGSLTGMLIEEAYEVVSAIERKEWAELKDELGDLLLHIAFHAQIAREHGEFLTHEIFESIREKIIRRHPHVFGEETGKSDAEIKGRWEEIKRREGNKLKTKKAIPALVEARKLQERAEYRQHAHSVESAPKDKLKSLLKSKDTAGLGELLFAVVALARELGIEPELALKRANERFAAEIEKATSDGRSKTD
ncbi:MazG family protein [Candidatus Acetothermia bacterium]|nr:MazG family protein [Candidatus Acetothermia bacterium]